MKKLLFLLAFTFIGQQAFSQMYIVTYTACTIFHPSNCVGQGHVLTKIDPSGNATYTCFNYTLHLEESHQNLITINQELNTIINQGYKFVETNSPKGSTLTTENPMFGNSSLLSVAEGTIWYFAAP